MEPAVQITASTPRPVSFRTSPGTCFDNYEPTGQETVVFLPGLKRTTHVVFLEVEEVGGSESEAHIPFVFSTATPS